MRYAIMSDVHGQVQALKTAIADARGCSAERLVLLGDMVGGGPSSSWEALAFCRSAFDVVVMGNCDADYAYAADLSFVGRETAEWLISLPELSVDGDAVFVHRGLRRDNGKMAAGFGYPFDEPTARRTFEAMDDGIRLAFIGHTHERKVWRCNALGDIEGGQDDCLYLANDARYIINVGSIGRPRSGMAASYVIYDSSQRKISFRQFD